MSSLAVLGGAGCGIFPVTKDACFYNRSGAALEVGDVMQVDMMPTPATESTSVVPGGEGTSIWSNVDSPNAAGIKSGVLCVALEAVADNAKGKFRISGIVDAYVIAASGSLVIGSILVATTGRDLDLVHATTERVCAVSLAAVATPTTHEVSSVWFHGEPAGFGPAIDLDT